MALGTYCIPSPTKKPSITNLPFYFILYELIYPHQLRKALNHLSLLFYSLLSEPLYLQELKSPQSPVSPSFPSL
jgi:hypothetical protein